MGKTRRVYPSVEGQRVGPRVSPPDLDSSPHLEAPAGMAITECGPQFYPGQRGTQRGWRSPNWPVTLELDLLSKEKQRSSEKTYHWWKCWEYITRNLWTQIQNFWGWLKWRKEFILFHCGPDDWPQAGSSSKTLSGRVPLCFWWSGLRLPCFAFSDHTTSF